MTIKHINITPLSKNKNSDATPLPAYKKKKLINSEVKLTISLNNKIDKIKDSMDKKTFFNKFDRVKNKIDHLIKKNKFNENNSL